MRAPKILRIPSMSPNLEQLCYFRHLNRIDRLIKYVIPDYAIWIFTGVGVTSTYLESGLICDIFLYHSFSQSSDALIKITTDWNPQ